MAMKRITVRLPVWLVEQVDFFAKSRGQSRSAFIREALENYLGEKRGRGKKKATRKSRMASGKRGSVRKRSSRKGKAR